MRSSSGSGSGVEDLRRIAGLADGDARIAIQTLKNAAYMAEKDEQKEIGLSHVSRAWNAAKDLKKTYLLRKLTDHHRLLYELISKNRGILSGDLWRLYLRNCNQKQVRPIAVRTYSDYCNNLIELGLEKLFGAGIGSKGMEYPLLKDQAKRAAIQGKVRQFSLPQ